MTVREKVVLEGEDRASKEFNKAGGSFEKMGATLKKVAIAGGIAISGRAIVGLGKQVTQMAIDADEAKAAFETTFGQALPEASRFVDDFANKAGFATHELQQMLAVTGNVVQGIGATETESAALAQSMATLAGDVASFSNAAGGAPVVLQALQSAINGEREALKTYGLAIAETEVQQRALNATGKTSVSQLTRLEKANATVAIAYEKAGKAVGDLDRTSDSAANTLRRIGGRLRDAGVQAGQKLLPALEQLLPVLEDAIPALTDAGVALAGLIASAGGPAAAALSQTANMIDGIAIAVNSVTAVGTRAGIALAEVFTLGHADTAAGAETARLAEHANDLHQAAIRARKAMADGVPALQSYHNELAFMSRASNVSHLALDKLATITGVTADEQARGIASILAQAEAYGIDSTEAAILSSELAVLRENHARANATAEGGNAVYRDAAFRLGDAAAAAAELGGVAGELGPEMQAASDALAETRAQAVETAIAFRKDLAQGVDDFLEGFEKAPDQVKITLKKFTKNFTDRQTQLEEFWAGMATLAAAGLTGLTDELATKGPEAAGFVTDLVRDMKAATDLNDVIVQGEAEVNRMTGAYASAIETGAAPAVAAMDTLGVDMIHAVAEGAASVDLARILASQINRAASQVAGIPTTPARGGGQGNTLHLQSGTWEVPGRGPVDATIHGGEIVIPPPGSRGRAQFATELASELGRVVGGKNERGVVIEQILVTVPAGTPVNEAIAAAGAQAAIEAFMS